MSDDLKRQAAIAALIEVTDGMTVGLGTGSTAKHFINGLGQRIRDEGLNITAVATSDVSHNQAQSLGITLKSLDDIGPLDVAVDGADEIDESLNLIKGGGGAHLREKLVAQAAKRFVVIADHSKCVDHLGAFPLPLEIVRFSPQAVLRDVQATLNAHGIHTTPAIRMKDGKPVISDNGQFIADCDCGRIADPAQLAADLDHIPGVLEHGLFINMANVAYVAGPNGIEVANGTI